MSIVCLGNPTSIGLNVKRFLIPSVGEDQVTPASLYNLMNDGTKYSCYIHDPLYMLLLDTRNMADYTSSHIQTAFHCTAVTSAVICQNIEKFSHIIVYGSDGVELSDNEHSEKAVKFLIDHQIEYEVLLGGYYEFSQRFPLMCNTITVWPQTERERIVAVYPSLVLEDWLYQGTGDQAKNEHVVGALGITHIVNISTEHNCSLDGVKYLTIRLQDDGSSRLIEHFEDIFEFLDEVKRTKGKALVHCNLGVSRSSTATISYIMLSERCSLFDAFTYLHHRRPVCAPNRGFFLQLGEFEKYIFGRSITDAAELWLAV